MYPHREGEYMDTYEERIKQNRSRSPSELTEEELIESLLYYCCRKEERESVIHTIMEYAPTIRSLLTLPAHILRTLPIPDRERCSAYISIIREYAIRASTPRYKSLFSHESSIEFAHMMCMKIGYYRTEVILGILLNKEKRFLCIENVALGSVNTAVFDVQTVIESIQRNNAHYVILVHNHPSGVCIPSVEDEEATACIAQGCKACGYDVLDHYIVTDKAVYSMYTQSYLIQENECNR